MSTVWSRITFKVSKGKEKIDSSQIVLTAIMAIIGLLQAFADKQIVGRETRDKKSTHH